MAQTAIRQTETGLHPLTYGQEALWFLHNLSPEHCAYKINIAWHIECELDIAFLTEALQAVVDNHPLLRTTFVDVGRGEVRQRVRGEMGLDFLQVDASCWSRDQLHQTIVQETYRPFDLMEGPALRRRLYRSGRAEYVLLLSIHHIITDYGSIVMMMEELSAMFTEGRIIATSAGTTGLSLCQGRIVLRHRPAKRRPTIQPVPRWLGCRLRPRGQMSLPYRKIISP